ncbi:MAG: transglycosylase SLT domain-containing protein [Alphaproteobacteria bacterium]
MKRRILILATVILLGAMRPASAVEADPCASYTAAMEHSQAIPTQLLAAISLAESGRFDQVRGEIIAWPWTINVGGEGRFFATKEEAIAAVKKLQKRGVTNIDVGCMQVNLHHHPDAFDSLDAAFDPFSNVAYAASFLKELKDETRSWPQAIAFYHSTTRQLNVPYRNKVYRLWADVRRREAEKMRQQVIAAYLERRAAEQARLAARQNPSRIALE